MRVDAPSFLVALSLLSFFFLLPGGRDHRTALMAEGHEAHEAHLHAHALQAGGMGGGMAPMPMYFMLSFRTLLWIKEWETTSLGQYLFSLMCVVALGICHEWLAYTRSSYAARIGKGTKGDGYDEGEATHGRQDRSVDGLAPRFNLHLPDAIQHNALPAAQQRFETRDAVPPSTPSGGCSCHSQR